VRNDPDCIFCRIVRGEIPSSRVYEDDHLIAFRDIQPLAPAHILIVPREHIPSIAELGSSDTELAGRLLVAAGMIAAGEGLESHGYRVVSNVGEWGGQTVSHLHLHILGGRQLGGLG
jgi:histidine triad (HIT) family protein